MKKIKIAYVTTYDSQDIHQWSGAGTGILKMLKSSGFEIELIGNLKDKFSLLFKLKKLVYAILFSKNYLRDREPIVLKSYAKQVEKQIAASNCDIVFSPGTIAISHLNIKKPIVFMTDATFAGMIDFYPSFSNLCSESIRHGNEMEQQSLSNCSLAIYESKWASKTAIENYKVDPKKIHSIPFGCNIECNRSMIDIEQLTMKKRFNACKLLFIGAEWERKGGDIAIDVVRRLNEKGFPTKLSLVGDKPGYDLPDYVEHFGFISRKNKEGFLLLDKLMSESHFFILPTQADATPLVFAEACSYGLPSLTTRVGGTTEAIIDGKNGQSFNLEDDIEIYCEYIIGLMSQPESYKKMAISSYKEYTDRLNWDISGKKVKALIHQL